MSPLIERTRSREARHGGAHRGDRPCVELVGDVIADAGQRAQVDFV